MSTTDRSYDVVLLGATGFTGALTAEYLARHAPDGCRWALAGRSTSKLEAVRAKLVAIDPTLADLPLVTAGPYRWLSHPNYVAVIVEGVALPLVHTNWLTATAFTLFNLPLLATRVRCENSALAAAPAAP